MGVIKVCSVTTLVALASLGARAAEGTHALIIGIANYAPQSRADPLPGVAHDVVNARRIARELGASNVSTVELRDAAATKQSILREFASLRKKVNRGDKVLVYLSGHGTRQSSPDGCTEGFSTYSGEMLTEAEIAAYTEPISRDADKLLVIVDACFSGGVIGSKPATSRSIANLTPRYTPGLAECARPLNQPPTRSLLSEYKRLGVRDENFVQISSAGHNEVSWDNPEFGGLATRSLTECLVEGAPDLNGSGAVSLEEVRVCAQRKMDALMAPFLKLGMLPSTLQVRGNRNLVVAPAPEVEKPLQVTPDTGSPAAPTVPVPPPARTTVEEIFAQRDPRRIVAVNAPTPLRIGKDRFQFTVKSSVDGYLYVLMLGSDESSYYVLFPNALDSDNRIKAGVSHEYPTAKWQVRPAGPRGTDRLLFVVAQHPRDLSVFANLGSAGGAFTTALADAPSRRRLVDMFLGKGTAGRATAFGAAMLEVDEVE